MLVREKVDQAVGILEEYGVDCWITFVRESGMMRDPMMDFLCPADMTWHSAFIVTRSGDEDSRPAFVEKLPRSDQRRNARCRPGADGRVQRRPAVHDRDLAGRDVGHGFREQDRVDEPRPVGVGFPFESKHSSAPVMNP